MYDAVVRLDNAAFHTADDVRAVLQCVPSQDEGNMLQSYVQAGGTLKGLSDAELFCLDLMKVSHDSYTTCTPSSCVRDCLSEVSKLHSCFFWILPISEHHSASQVRRDLTCQGLFAAIISAKHALLAARCAVSLQSTHFFA